MLDVVVPCLNASDRLPAALAALAGLPVRVTVSDGGSTDGTAAVAASLGAAVVTAPRGRGTQLAAGAAAGSAPWLLFLHADTWLSPGWWGCAAAFVADPANARRAGYFRLRYRSDAPAARRVAALAAWRARAFGLPYGDQGLLIARAFYEEIGGFRPLVLMEDVDLARRIGRRRLVALDAEALTSAERYEREGWLRRPARNLVCLGLYHLGVPPRWIARLYA